MPRKPKKEIYMNNPALPTVEAQFEWTPEMVAELKKCKDNILHFAENHFYIISLDDGKQKITLHPYQKKALRMIRDNRFSIMLFSRQTGKSTLATIFMLWIAIFNDDQKLLLVANKESTAKEIFRRIRVAYEGLPNWLKAPVTYYGLESLELQNGSRISITTTTGTAGRGSSANLLFVDEMAFIEKNLLDEFWSSVYPIISSSRKSKIIVASTPKDTSGLLYKLYDESVKGTNGWANMKVLWNDVPGRDEKWKNETMAALGDPTIFSREFECAFDEVGESAIDAELFDDMRRYTMEPMYIFENGCYHLWEKPNEERIYVAGVDISEGVGKDATVIQVLDITEPTRIKQVAVYNNNKISPSEFTPKLREILQHWGDPLAMIERNGCGAQVVDNLKRDFNYDNIVNWGINKVVNRKSMQHGLVSHTNTKYTGVMNQRYWVNTAKCVQINDINTVLEMKDFVRQKSGHWSAKHGANDDRVMALVWALMILHEEIAQVYFDIIDKDEFGKPRVIKSMDYGIKYFNNPTSIYTNEKTGLGGDAMPMIFGGMNSDITDMDDLINGGWKPLNY
jgi:hypothetical protein